jgi:hypothetical protein
MFFCRKSRKNDVTNFLKTDNSFDFFIAFGTGAGSLKLKWRPGRDSDPGPAGDSRIYWTELYYLGTSAATIHEPLSN